MRMDNKHRKELLKMILKDVHKIEGIGCDWLKAVWDKIGEKVDYDVTIKEIQDCILELGIEDGGAFKRNRFSMTLTGVSDEDKR